MSNDATLTSKGQATIPKDIRDSLSMKARKLIRREVAAGSGVFVNQLVLLETEWVLRSRYSLPKNLIIEAISGLLDEKWLRLFEQFYPKR